MDSTVRALADTFMLSVIANQLDGFQPPEGAFDPAGEWEQSYGVIAVGQVSSGRVGRLLLRRRKGGVLTVDYELAGPGNTVHRERAVIHYKPDPFPTPQRWEVQWGVHQADGRLVPHTALSKSGAVVGDEIRVSDSATERRFPAPHAFTLRWLLFDAVQRLPQSDFPPKRFALLDDSSAASSPLTLARRESFRVRLGGKPAVKQQWRQLERGRIRHAYRGREGGRPVTLTAYSAVGHGTVPWMFWVDSERRLLFAAVGLEAFVLEGAKQG